MGCGNVDQEIGLKREKDGEETIRMVGFLYEAVARGTFVRTTKLGFFLFATLDGLDISLSPIQNLKHSFITFIYQIVYYF